MDFSKKLNELKPMDLNCNIFSVYDYNGFTIQEILNVFFSKLNECVEVSNKTLELADWLVKVGLPQEVVKKLMEWLDDGTLENLINENLFKSLNDKISSTESNLNKAIESVKVLENKNKMVSVINYGAKGDGITDDTNAIVECFNYCTDNGYTMFFPNGKYILNQRLQKSSHPITDNNSNKEIYIVGESAYGVWIETTNATQPVIDVSRSKYVYLENLFSNSSWFKVVQYGDDFRDFSRVRDVYISNVGSTNRNSGFPSWNIFINTPSPKSYQSEEVDSRYVRYPLEIVSNSGYNPIMINNFANKNDDGSTGYPTDNSSIGIIDEVTNSSGAILIDGGKRAFYQCQNGNAEFKSGVRNNVVYEVDGQGHIGVGCSTQNNDSVAPGKHVVKLRDSYPELAIYDSNRKNRKSLFGSGDNKTFIKAYNETGDKWYGIEIDYKTGSIDVKGSLNIGSLLTWSDKKPSKNLDNISSIHVTSGTISRFENVEGGKEGQIVTIVSNGSLTVNHNRDDWGNIRTTTKQDVLLESDVPYTITKVNGLWYLK